MVAAVPQIEGLTVEDMLELAKTSPNSLKFIPDERDWDHMDRKWLSDILNTVDRAKFEKMIKDAAKERKTRLEEKRNLVVEMRPEFAQAFQSCMNFSSKIFIVINLPINGKRASLKLDEVLNEAKEDSRGTRGKEAGSGGAQD